MRKERYRYSAYGSPVKLNANWTGGGAMYDDIPLFTGQRRNWINGMYNYKARYYRGHRFLQTDPPGAWYDNINFGNLFGYVGSDPINRTDPLGYGPAPSVGAGIRQHIADCITSCCMDALQGYTAFLRCCFEEIFTILSWGKIKPGEFIDYIKKARYRKAKKLPGRDDVRARAKIT